MLPSWSYIHPVYTSLMTRTTIFKNNRTQSVRLAKEVAFPESVREVDVVVVGSSRLVSPRGRTWEHWFAHGPTVTEDFLVDRDEPLPEDRGTL